MNQLIRILSIAFLGLLITPSQAQSVPSDQGNTLTTTPESSSVIFRNTLNTLESFVDVRNSILQDIKGINEQFVESKSDAEKQKLQLQLDKLESELRATTENFENVAAGIDITSLREEEEEEFSFQREVLSLLRPALDEMREMTSHVRQKSELKEEINYYNEKLPLLGRALENVNRLLVRSEDGAVWDALSITMDKWRKQQTFMRAEIKASQLQLEKLIDEEVSIAEASQSYLKKFFQQRGLYLTIAVLTVVGILVLSQFSRQALKRYIPGFRNVHRSFRIRLIELFHRGTTVLFVILGPMIVFYIAEDWVLFSLSILFLLGLALMLRQTLPRYIHQIQLFLNIGSVREGERLYLNGLPWLVKQINIFSTLINPVADLTQRIPIDDLVELRSRPLRHDEPWFPCRKGDWVILSDGVRGKVTGISPELIHLVERGGAQITYQTCDFLAKSPRNLATNFRIKETIGICYELQDQSTERIPETLYSYIQNRLEQEGYGDKLINLRVEFAQANISSLDLAIIADFKGEVGDLYNRLRRAIQRWSVDACTEYSWNIPYPQMTIHGASETSSILASKA